MKGRKEARRALRVSFRPFPQPTPDLIEKFPEKIYPDEGGYISAERSEDVNLTN